MSMLSSLWQMLPAIFLVVCSWSATLPHASAAESGVNGRNATVVEFGQGSSRLGQLRQTGPRQWVELNAAGQVTFRFDETQRDESSVYLLDRSRGVTLQLNLNTKKVLYSAGGSPRSELYDILAAAAPPVPQAAATTAGAPPPPPPPATTAAAPPPPPPSPPATAAVAAQPASGQKVKQCVWNKSGVVLRVEWYSPNDIRRDAKSNVPYVRQNAKPLQTDVFPLAQGRCREGSQLSVAVLTIEGAEWVKKGLTIGAVTATAIVTGVVGAVACGATAGAGCAPAAAGIGAAVGGVSAVAAEFIPEPKQLGDKPGVFAIEIPSTTHWLDVWGTAWDPQVGQGGRL